MKKIRSKSLILLSVFLIACSFVRLEIKLASNQEIIPSPNFIVNNDITNYSKDGKGESKIVALPYRRIRFYKMIDGCSIINYDCQLIWHLKLDGEKLEILNIKYAVPLQGSKEIHKAEKLEPNQKYFASVDCENSSALGCFGTQLFRVDGNGNVIIDPLIPTMPKLK